MRKTFLISFCLLSLIGKSQNFTLETKVDSVKEKGFYNILLSPTINSNLKSDFSDIRLFDEKNNEVPYLHRTEIPTKQTQLFKEYKIVSKEIVKGCCTRIVLYNPIKSKINNISLVIKNADVQKRLKLSGSDDQQNWFVVKDHYLFCSIYSNSETSEIKLLNFPLSNYTYYKIEINDSASAPINVLKAGFYDTYSENGKYANIPVNEITQWDSIKQKRTYVKVSFDAPQYIDKLDLEIDGPVYYLRKATISILRKDSIKKRESRVYFENLQEIQLASNEMNTIYFSNFKAKEFYIIIDNEDNQPLHIRSAKASQLNHYLTAYLEKEKQYVLKFGDSQLGNASYDLKYFQDSIPTNIPLLLTEKTHPLTTEEMKFESSWFSNKAVLWVVLGLVIVLLALLSVKMIREMK